MTELGLDILFRMYILAESLLNLTNPTLTNPNHSSSADKTIRKSEFK